MPHLIIAPQAARGMARCYRFLHEQSPEAADRAQEVILQRLSVLKRSPRLGRPYEKDRTLRELVIRFGKRGGYLALYRYEPEHDMVRILAFKHGLEERYRS